MAPASLIVSPHGEGGKGAGANKAEAHVALVAAGLTPTAGPLVKEVHEDTSRLGMRQAMTSPTTAGSLQDARPALLRPQQLGVRGEAKCLFPARGGSTGSRTQHWRAPGRRQRGRAAGAHPGVDRAAGLGAPNPTWSSL